MSNYPEGVEAFCKKYGIARNECWSAHGTWVVKHSAIERVAQANKITFDPPVIVEADSAAKIAVVQVVGHMEGVSSEWSFGEAAPSNNKNAYPFAMAEKRAKDRVALKLLGGHGILYSQDEIDERAPDQELANEGVEHEPSPPASNTWEAVTKRLLAEVAGAASRDELDTLIDNPDFRQFRQRAPRDHKVEVSDAVQRKRAIYEQGVAA